MKSRLKPSKPSGMAALEVLLALSVLAVIVIVGFFVLLRRSDPIAGCTTADGVKFCVQASAASVSPTGSLTMHATFTNQTDSPYRTAPIYSSSCNQPVVVINGQDIANNEICTEDEVAITIPPHQSLNYDVPIAVSNLRQGKNKIILKWDQSIFVSPTLIISLKTASKADTLNEQGCLKDQSVETYCALIDITVKANYYSASSTCDELAGYVKPIGLVAFQKYCDLANSGILFVSVPQTDAASWVTKIKQLPQINSASISQN